MKLKYIQSKTLKLLLVFQLIVISKLVAQNAAINTMGNAPDISAMLDISSTSQGLLMPRMTTAQMNAIYQPATGLLIYNTSSNLFEVNIGTAATPNWVPIGTSQTGWNITGNGGTNSNTNFLGTTDNTSLYFKTNSQNRIKIDSIGEIGIGTNLPTAQLHTTGTVRFAGLGSSTGNGSVLSTDANGNITTTTISSILGTSTNTLANSANTIISTINGVAASAPVVNTVSNTVSGNTVLTTVNGVPGSAVTVPNIYTADGTLAVSRTVTQGSNTLAFTNTATNAFSVAGTTFSVDGANSRVGIGTASPSTTIDVNGAARIENSPAVSTSDIVSTLVTDANGNIKKQSSSIISAARFTTTVSGVVNGSLTTVASSGTKAFDNLSEVSSAAVFQPKAAGLYSVIIKGSFPQEGTLDGFIGGVEVYLNGVVDDQCRSKIFLTESGGTASFLTISENDLMKLATTDQVSFRVFTYGADVNTNITVTVLIQRVD